MTRLLKILLALCLLPLSIAWGQSTAISATITDTDGIVWSGGSYQIVFSPAPNVPSFNSYIWTGGAFTTQFSGYLDGSGAFSISLPSSSAIGPAGSLWSFTICPNASSGCFTTSQYVTGSTQNLTSILSALAKGPRFSAIAGAYGYSDIETQITLPAGATYWNITLQNQRYWNGSTWINGGLPPGWTTNGAVDSTQVVTAPGTLAAGATTPVTIGGATGSCAGKYAKADGTGCGNPGDGGGSSARWPGLNVFGDSIAALTGCTVPAFCFVPLLAQQITGPLNNNAVSGYWITDEPLQMYKPGFGYDVIAYPTQANNPLSLEEGGKNDGTNCAINANCISNSQFALQTILSHRGTSNIVAASTCTQGGTWTTDAVLTTIPASTTNGSTLTCTITTYGSSAIGVTYRAITSNGGTASVTIDSVLQGTGIVAAGVGGSNITLGARPSIFTNLYPVTAGTHTVIITVTSATSGSNLIAIPDIVAGNNPAVTYVASPFVGSMEVLPQQNNVNPTYYSSINTMKQAVVTALSGYGFSVKWLPLVNVPYTGAFNNVTYINNQPSVFDPDGLSCAAGTTDATHPNNCGHKEILQALQNDLGISPSVAPVGVRGTKIISGGSYTVTLQDDVIETKSSATIALTALNMTSIGTGSSFVVAITNVDSVNTTTITGGNTDVPVTLLPYSGVVVKLSGYTNAWSVVSSFNVPSRITVLNPILQAASHTVAIGDNSIYDNTAGSTITLPASGALPVGFQITLFNVSTGVMNITNLGVSGNVPSSIPSNSSITVQQLVAGGWYVASNGNDSYIGTTTSIGGGALLLNACASGTVTVTGAIVGRPVTWGISDGTLVSALGGAGFYSVDAAVTSANTVTVEVCALTAGTPAAKTYNVRVPR